MMYEVTFIREGKTIQAERGTTLLQAQILAGLKPDAPCGGQGTCGKCLVRIPENPDAGIVKACQTKITGPVSVDTLIREKEHAILAEGLTRPVPLKPALHLARIEIPPVKPGDNLSDWYRLKSALAQASGEDMANLEPDLQTASCLYQMLKENTVWYAAFTKDRLFDLRKEPFEGYLAAFDIGTTTVVGYLLDSRTGRVLAIESRMNPQSQYGADVIMRSNYALEHGLDSLSACIREAIRQILKALASQASIDSRDIFQMCVVGNTCMHHLFLGISPGALVHAPYNPAISQLLCLNASDYDMPVHPRAQLILLPNIAGFVGADTMGCLLCIRPDRKEEITLMIDIGTNGEMVLGSRQRLAACSTAAGPAFEGAKIECGMRGAAGAVDHVEYQNGVWSYTTVNNEKPAGLCGSGLIDLIAALRKADIIDDSGKMTSQEDNPAVFTLVPAEEGAEGKPVYLTQKDVREVQLAKAAIAAGICLLEEELGITEEDIAQVCIAGAFGNYMNPHSACDIGLIPLSLKEKIIPIGNAAGEGAKIALLNRDELEDSKKMAEEISFVELAASPKFQDCFVDELEFPALEYEGGLLHD